MAANAAGSVRAASRPLRHLRGIAARGLRQLLEDVGGEGEELLGERVGAGQRTDLLVGGPGLGIPGDRRGAQRGIEQHLQRRR
jgi:hypothetical protein